MKMSFKFAMGKKFFRVLFDVEFICLFDQWHEIQTLAKLTYISISDTATASINIHVVLALTTLVLAITYISFIIRFISQTY